MKKLFFLFCFVAIALTRVFGQVPIEKMAPQAQPGQLTKFDLDFRGGTPGELVVAIEKASGRPLNAIVPVEHAGRKLPPLKMKNVDVAQLFKALQSASVTSSVQRTGNSGYQHVITQAGFRTDPKERLSDDAVWFFYVEGGAPTLPSSTRFYLLTPYLNGGLTVDDITTAIQTGWRMRGDATIPTLSFHKETKLLIAVGDQPGLEVIDAVLKALDSVKVSAPPPTGDKPADQPKTKQ